MNDSAPKDLNATLSRLDNAFDEYFEKSRQVINSSRAILKIILQTAEDLDLAVMPVPKFIPSGVNISCMMITESLEDVVILLKELAKHDVRRLDPSKYKDTNVLNVMSMRSFELTHNITLDVVLTGEKCRMVQTGTQEVPVYEMTCD